MALPGPDDWRESGHTFGWRGHRIFYRVDGAGDPVVLVHGFPTASWDWCAVWPALAAKYRVVTLDMIGFGFSAKPRDFAYTVAAQADLIHALLAREAIAEYRIVAHDFGVTVTQELLARRTASPKIIAACLLNGGLFPETHRALLTQRLLASPIGALVARLARYRTFASSMKQVWGSQPIDDRELRQMWRLVTENDGMRVMPKLIGYMGERRRFRDRWVGALADAAVPIRLINGLLDPVSGAHMLVRYRELIPNPEIVELRDVGHYPQVEAPAAVVDAITGWFDRT